MALERLTSLVLVFVITAGLQAGPSDGPNTIDDTNLAWIANAEPLDPNCCVVFETATGLIVYDGEVYADAEYFESSEQLSTDFDYTNSQVFAYDTNSGKILLVVAIDEPMWDLCSTASIDTKNNAVPIGSGDKVFSITTTGQGGPDDWPCYGHTVTRHCIAVDGPDKIDDTTLAWVADADPQDPNYYVEFESASGPIVYEGKVYAYAKYFEPNEQSPTGFDYTNSQIVAYDANSGEMLWATVVDRAVGDSWSSPCIDTKNNTVLIGSGDKVFAIDAVSGEQLWASQLEKDVVNASACVAIDLTYARAFITDYDWFTSNDNLYCINLDPNEPNNPYEPGDIVWSQTIGESSGNTPAYNNGVVYVTSYIGPNTTTGTIFAFDAAAGPNAVKLWDVTDPNFEGFFGGVVVTKEGFLYAATYGFYGGEDNSSLCKIDCNDGSIVWIAQTERTDSMPVVIGDKIYISGGIDGYGSRPKVEAYQDDGNSVTKLWETDANLYIGGYTNQPVYADGKLYVGAIPLDGNYFGSYDELYILDVSVTPDDPNFIIAHYTNKQCGNNPAVTYDSIYTLGYDGLFKFHQPAFLGDVSEDKRIDFYDLAVFVDSWLWDGAIGKNRSDFTLDGEINFVDYSFMASEWGSEMD